MARDRSRERKQRTRQHVIADLSVNFVERVILDEGHAAQRPSADYGSDLVMQTHDGQGEAKPGFVLFQLKASDSLAGSGDFFSYDLDIRDYNLWMSEPSPVLLVLYDAPNRRAYWVHIQGYFEAGGPRPRDGARTVRVRVSRAARFNRRAVRAIRAFKAAGVIRIAEGT